MDLFSKTSFQVSEQLTKNYTTSFYSATRLLNREMREAIFSIYGFVRLSDEIVDTFHDYNKRSLLQQLEKDYYDGIKQGISLNPILNSFQLTVKKYKIQDEHIQAFLKSMKSDLDKKTYNNLAEVNDYIYGYADVIGLMCLKVFCNGDYKIYDELKPFAMRLGSAFQKVNFLRDLKNDIENLERRYFPQLANATFNEEIKSNIIEDIEGDFKQAYKGIKKLPRSSKLAVLTAYLYYMALLRKIKRTPANKIISGRIRIPNSKKLSLLTRAFISNKFDLV